MKQNLKLGAVATLCTLMAPMSAQAHEGIEDSGSFFVGLSHSLLHFLEGMSIICAVLIGLYLAVRTVKWLRDVRS